MCTEFMLNFCHEKLIANNALCNFQMVIKIGNKLNAFNEGRCQGFGTLKVRIILVNVVSYQSQQPI